MVIFKASATETGSIVLNTSYPVSWSLSNENSNAGVLSYTNSGNLVITYRKNLVIEWWNIWFWRICGLSIYIYTTATMHSIITFNYTINVTHRYYNPVEEEVVEVIPLHPMIKIYSRTQMTLMILSIH